MRTIIASLALVIGLAAPAFAEPGKHDEKPQQKQDKQNRPQEQPRKEQPRGEQQHVEKQEPAREQQRGNEHAGNERPGSEGKRPDAPHSEAARHEAPGHQGGPREFREDDRARLQKHYAKILPNVDREHRPRFNAGAPVPEGYRGHFTAPPANLVRHLPPPPEGCQYGYYQGYVVTYNPATFVIASVIDLLLTN